MPLDRQQRADGNQQRPAVGQGQREFLGDHRAHRAVIERPEQIAVEAGIMHIDIAHGQREALHVAGQRLAHRQDPVGPF